MNYPAPLDQYATEITMVLVFVDGLLFGVAFKKAIASIILVIVAIIIASFLGLAFIPNISLTGLISQLVSYAQGTKLGSLVVSFTIVLFVIGLGIGIWKG
ncbi:hypothetical protein ApAK_00130 [Thermoplasmatales archaeon AK]|nr:hypothetical protein [Thermoplasmatales archaeon AK]